MLEILEAVGREYGFSLDMPLNELSEAQLKVLLYGSEKKMRVKHKSYQGRWHEYDVQYRGRGQHRQAPPRRDQFGRRYAPELERYMSDRPCPACRGQRLKPESLSVTIDDKAISHVGAFSVREAARFFTYLAGDTDKPTPLSEKEQFIARQILKEIRERLGFLMDVGLELPEHQSHGSYAGGRRSPAHPAGHADRLVPHGRALHPGRAIHRPAPTRQRPPHQYPHPPARPGQHPHRGGA